MAVNQDDDFNKLVQLVSKYPTDSEVKEMIALMSSAIVNRHVGKESLIVHYLRTCSRPDRKILTAFEANGCDFNIQGHDGQTPLQLVIGKKSYSKDQEEAIKLLVTNGGDSSVEDIANNNLLMVVVLAGQSTTVLRLLSKDRELTKRLITQKNLLGHDVLALFFLSGYEQCGYRDDFDYTIRNRLVHLLELGADVHITDTNGDTCLHHLVRGPDKTYLPALYNDLSDRVIDPVRAFIFRRKQFKSHLNMLINAGADNSQQNKSGLIPLQVALSTKPKMFESILDLEPLAPDEDVLELLVPRPSNETMLNEPANLSVQVWFVAQLSTNNMTISRKLNFSILRASNYYSSEVLRHLLWKRGVKPTAEDFKVPFLAQNDLEVHLYINSMLPKDIRDINAVIPNIIDQVLSSDVFGLDTKECLVERLVSTGLLVTVNHLKLALDKHNFTIAQDLVDNMDCSMEDDLKRKIPDVLIQILRLSKTASDWARRTLESTVENIINKFNVNVNYVNQSKDSAIQCILYIVREGCLNKEVEMKLFDIVTDQEEFDFDQTVTSGNHNEYIEARPIEMVMQMQPFTVQKSNMAVKLIMAGADVRGIKYDHLNHTTAALKLLKLLYHLGIYVIIVEGDLIYNWARERSKKSLQGYAAMAVRRNSTRKELNNAISDIVLPENVSRFLELKHFDLDC